VRTSYTTGRDVTDIVNKIPLAPNIPHVPSIPNLAEGATVLPRAGGTLVRVAEAGRAESVVDTGKLNRLLDRALSPDPPRSLVIAGS
jgi:hypothetical protein